MSKHPCWFFSLHSLKNEDEALALAIQASLNQSGPSQQAPPSKPLTAQEKEDLALAQALAQSEKDEAERRRRVIINSIAILINFQKTSLHVNVCQL